MSNTDLDPQVVVIGGGPGGYTAGIRLGQLDREVVLVEKEEIGGVCLNWGCIPTKALYSVTEPLSKQESWRERGIEVGEICVELEDLRRNQDRVVSKLTKGVEKLIESSGTEIINGEARLEPGPTVEVRREGEENLDFQPQQVVLATGSAPVEIPGFSLDDPFVWSSRESLELKEIPEKMVILGAGVIGMEMATIYNRLGSEVEVVELLNSILPTVDMDRKPKALLARSLREQGISLNTGWKAQGLRKKDDYCVIDIEKDGEKEELKGNKVLLAVGRKPQFECVDSELDLETTEDGYIEVNEKMKTNLDGVYAIGDVVGPPLLAHKASKQGLIAAASIHGKGTEGYRAMPSAIFTDPEFASVGMSETKAREEVGEVKTGTFPLRASGKAVAMDEIEGMVKVVAEAGTEEIVGGQILSPHASDMVAELALAVEKGLTLEELGGTVHPHPTLSEAVMEAAENSLGRSIHVSNK